MTRSDSYKTGDVLTAARDLPTGDNLQSETFYKGGKGEELADYSYNYKAGTRTVKNVSVYYYASIRAESVTDPETAMDKMLYAFDELSGFVHAYSLMRPGGYEDMDVKGVKKRLKDKAFAAGVSREDIRDACERAQIELDELIQFVIPRQAAFTANHA
jgi:hypothetical protein